MAKAVYPYLAIIIITIKMLNDSNNNNKKNNDNDKHNICFLQIILCAETVGNSTLCLSSFVFSSVFIKFVHLV